MSIKMFTLEKQYENLKEEMISKLDEVMKQSNFILGENVRNIENDLSDYSHTKYGIGVGNGSDAIHISLLAAGIKEGDEVITTAFTFFATGGAIARAKATPVFVDIDPNTYNIDPNKIKEAITDKTKAIVPVHLYGQMADMKKIMEIATQYNIAVIEDAAQSIGANRDEVRPGEVSSAATYSFFPTKNLGAYGDGGMIVTNNQKIDETSRIIRVHGSKPKYYHHVLGYNSRLDELQAAVLNVKFKYLEEYTEARRNIANYYTERLNNELEDLIYTPTEVENSRHVYHQYTIRTEHRDDLQEYLKKNDIASTVYYPVPLHLQPVFSYLNYKNGDLPETEKAISEVLSLPIYPEMDRSEQDIVINCIVRFFEENNIKIK